ncbi:uncharacterized protein LOC112598674 isoform X4 [Melanaphis sacchari]|uniref:uncharacterized protein LOC112598674 isoform X4 n=1 Tax=Melanaphis sacchari TaxID=742174 RepID=UPI000DC14904|nr:uncharacterized protein LOC112598674 isoform X4 [Melanaphis sacchari]
MKYFAYFATCHFFGLVVTYDIFGDISSALNTMGNEFSKVPNTVNTGINAIGNEFSKVPDTVNTGMNAIGKEVSKVPKWISDVGCSEFVTGIVINLLIKCNPHAFITDTLDTEDIIMMNTCKSIEVVSYVLPLIADLATSPVQIVCSVWIEDRLELYSHLKGIDVHTGPSGTNFINNDELFYNLSKLNDQHCNNDCNLDDYVFIKLDERNESSADTTSSPSDVTRFKRGIFGKALSIPTKVIVKKYTVKAAPKLLMKNGVTSTLAFRGLNGLVSNKMTTKTSVMIFNIIENKPLDKVKNVYDVFVLTKTVPTTFTRKYYNNVYGTYKFGREAAENFQRDLTKKESKLLQTLIQHIDN